MRSIHQLIFWIGRSNHLLQSLLILINLFAFGLFSSCSHFQKNSQSLEESKELNFNDAVSGVCLSGEGKAKIEDGKKHYSTSFETIWEKENQAWKSVFNVPLYGEESLFVFYGKDPEMTFSGSLWEKNRHERSTNIFLKKFGQFLLFWEDLLKRKELPQGCKVLKKSESGEVIKGLCLSQIKSNNFHILFKLQKSGELILRLPVSKEYYFEVVTDNFDQQFYRTLFFSLKEKKRKVWVFEMNFNECSSLQ